MIELNEGQDKAFGEIMSAISRGDRYVLTGFAGSGKTTLMQSIAHMCQQRGLQISLTAPTHKAVSVLSRKLEESGLEDVPCRTIHSLLSLKPKIVADRQIFIRNKNAPPVMDDVVVIDECSMISADLMAHIHRYLPLSFVLFVGDPAQLPPVGEIASQTFDTKAQSHLDTIVRQAEGNPILAAAQIIRMSQGGDMDMSWAKSATAAPFGIFNPRDPNAWMKKAFTSDAFDADPDSFRYLAWTNERVAQINRQIRMWRYGKTEMPFIVGERAMFRAPFVRGEDIIFRTNEEVTVIEIEKTKLEFDFAQLGKLDGWHVSVDGWRIVMLRDNHTTDEVQFIEGDIDHNAITARLIDEAAQTAYRWDDLHRFKGSIARLQHIYALTVHNSQGSTFRNTFIDVRDIHRRAKSNKLECQKLFYVGATRPTHALILVGTP